MSAADIAYRKALGLGNAIHNRREYDIADLGERLAHAVSEFIGES